MACSSAGVRLGGVRGGDWCWVRTYLRLFMVRDWAGRGFCTCFVVNRDIERCKT